MSAQPIEFPEKPSRIAWLPLDIIKIAYADPGPGYQRPPDMAQVRRIARAWDWMMLDPIVVSVRQGEPDPGGHYVVAGQHRLLAARIALEAGDTIPARLLYLTFKEEAALFGRGDENRRKINARDLFRSNLTAEDPDTIAMVELVGRQGWVIHASGNQHGPGGGRRNSHDIVAVKTITKIYSGFGPDNLELTLKVLGEAYGHTPEAVDNRLLQGVSHCFHHFPVMILREFTEKLTRPKGAPPLLYQRAAVYGTGASGAISYCWAMWELYNLGRNQSTRLDWDLRKYRNLPPDGRRSTVAYALRQLAGD